MKIAVAHTPVSADIPVNGMIIRELATIASNDGARLVHFPEGALSGYAKDNIRDWSEMNWAALQDETARLKQLAGDLGIWIVLGSTHPNETKRPHNSMMVLSDRGGLHNRYDKRVCSHNEFKDWYTPGTSELTFEIDGYRFGCALCIEVHFSELFSRYREQGADCILLSSFSQDPIFEVTTRAHASMNNLWFSYATPSNLPQPVASSLIGPDGHPISAAKAGCTSLAFATLDREDPKWHVPLKRARPWRDQIRRNRL